MRNELDKLDGYPSDNGGFTYKKWPFYWIARVNSRYSQQMEKALKRVGLTITGWRVSMLLREHAVLSISEISTHSAVKLSTVTRTVYGMQDKGLLLARPRETDARVTEVVMTRQGRQLIETVIEQTSVVFADALKNFSEKELVSLNESLQRIFANLADE